MTAVGLNVLLLQSWIPFPNYFFSLNGVSWSLSVEMFFYCMFPLISYHWRVTWWWKIVLCGLVVIGLVHYAYAAKLPFETPEEILSIDALVYILPLARLPDFVLGIGACSIWLHVRHSLSTLPAFVSSVLEVSCLGLTFAAMHWVGPLVWSMMTANIISQAGGKWLSEGAVVPVMALMICVLATGRGMVSRLLSHRSLVLLGEISFSIYMTHQILMRALVPNRNLLIFGGMAAQYAAYWILVLFVSFLLWQFVEKPCRRGIVEVYDRAVA
jgi:peptidoglycan/LPS O-acetylase OafA/YrhL